LNNSFVTLIPVATTDGLNDDEMRAWHAFLAAGALVDRRLDQQLKEDAGLDTYEANTALGFPEDPRDYTAAAQMLAALGIDQLDLLTNNPDKASQLRELGVAVRDSTSTGVFATDSNLRYLRAKVDHTRHDIDLAGIAGLVG
jgi:GTP cyclohydrolase II